ncbi:MAG: hypothetical protein R6X14_04370 [bacterium]
MRRIVLIGAIVVAVGVAALFLVRPKAKPAPSRSSRAGTEAEEGTETRTSSRRSGRSRVAGRVRPRTKAELRAERKTARRAERQRKREAKRRERERRRQLKAARSRRGSRRSGRRGKKGQLYTVSAIVSLGSDSYALVDGRRVMVGDVIMGRRIVEIGADRVIVEAFGRRSTVRVGQSIVPLTFSTSRRRR